MPPGDAVRTAERFVNALKGMEKKEEVVGRELWYVDLNAISPATAKGIARMFEGTGCAYLDGGVGWFFFLFFLFYVLSCLLLLASRSRGKYVLERKGTFLRRIVLTYGMGLNTRSSAARRSCNRMTMVVVVDGRNRVSFFPALIN